VKYAHEKVDNLTEELDETRRKLVASEESRSSSQTEMSDVEKKLAETKLKVDRLERVKSELQVSENDLDLLKSRPQSFP
jgi:chromosome segregation ATPase